MGHYNFLNKVDGGLKVKFVKCENALQDLYAKSQLSWDIHKPQRCSTFQLFM